MSPRLQDLMRQLPAVNELLDAYRDRVPSDGERDAKLLTRLARLVLDAERSRLRRQSENGGSPSPRGLEALARTMGDALHDFDRPRTHAVVNATGVVLHSGLGRAPWPDAAFDALAATRRYCLLEVDAEEGKRRRRDAFCEDLLVELTGAEAAFVVNNNAAATLIILNTLGAEKEIVVSRSQMIEIGGSFRLPDVFEASGCRLREVGTTNRSYVRDYEAVLNDDTAALLLVHTSNYRIVGFTEHVDLPELVTLGREHGIPVIHDVGSGSLIDLTPLGIPDEPPVQASVKAGADVICFSGDKLIGGPQAGIIVGKREWIEKIRKNPLARALRIDKVTCVALEATLKLYLEPGGLFDNVPTLSALTESMDTIEKRAASLQRKLEEILGDRGAALLLEDTSELGAGTLPTHGLPTVCVAVDLKTVGANDLARALRMGRPSVFGRIKDDFVLLDARTIGDDEVSLVSESLQHIVEDLDS